MQFRAIFLAGSIFFSYLCSRKGVRLLKIEENYWKYITYQSYERVSVEHNNACLSVGRVER